MPQSVGSNGRLDGEGGGEEKEGTHWWREIPTPSWLTVCLFLMMAAFANQNVTKMGGLRPIELGRHRDNCDKSISLKHLPDPDCYN